MGLFDNSLSAKIDALVDLVAKITDEEGSVKVKVRLNRTIESLRAEIEILKLEKGRLDEENERNEREVRHEVGLLRLQVEAEKKIATDEAVLAVKQENLQADQARFEQQMAFTTERFEKEVGYLRDILEQIMARLPTVTVDREIKGRKR